MRLASGLVLLFLAGCRAGGGGGGPEPSGRLEVTWTDSAGSMRFAVPAAAAWCGADSLIEIIGTRQDTSVGIVLLAMDSLAGLGTTTYPVMPAKVFTPWRPRSIAGVRMVEAVAVKSYESGSGEVAVTGGGGQLSGTLDLRLVASNGPDSLHVTGAFYDLPVVPARLPCGRIDKPAS